MSTCWCARWYYKLTVSIRGYPCWQTAKADGYQISIGYHITIECYSCKYAASSAAAYTVRNRKRCYWGYSQTTGTDYQCTCYGLAIGWGKLFAYSISNSMSTRWSARWYYKLTVSIRGYSCWQAAKADGYRISIGYRCAV